MINETLGYRNFTGSIEVDPEDGMLHGQVLFIRDTITYEGWTYPELKSDFERAIDEYLALCERRGMEPKKPCTGTFQVRIGPELHETASLEAYRNGQSLNQFVKDVVQDHVEKAHTQRVDHYHHHRIETPAPDYLHKTSFAAQRPSQEGQKWAPNMKLSLGHTEQLSKVLN